MTAGEHQARDDDEGGDAGAACTVGEPLHAEPAVPRGCNPLVFGVVMATVQMAVLLWLLFGR